MDKLQLEVLAKAGYAVAQEALSKYNDNHDEKGQFSSGDAHEAAGIAHEEAGTAHAQAAMKLRDAERASARGPSMFSSARGIEAREASELTRPR